MELRFGKRHIKVNTLIALTSFISERSDSDHHQQLGVYAIAEVIRNRDCKLWNTITDTPSHPLYQLLPPKKQRFLRNRGHKFILPAVKTERFKRSFINRCLFNFI